MCTSLNIDIAKFQTARKRHIASARIGAISTKEYLSGIAKELDLSYNELFTHWLRTKRENMVIDEEIEELINSLKKNGCVVGTVTNVIELHNRVRIEKHAYDLFDFAVVSCEEGVEKPDEDIYRLALNKLEFPPEEIVFVDDTEINLETAKRLGMKTIFFKDNTQLLSDLKKISVKV